MKGKWIISKKNSWFINNFIFLYKKTVCQPTDTMPGQTKKKTGETKNKQTWQLNGNSFYKVVFMIQKVM